MSSRTPALASRQHLGQHRRELKEPLVGGLQDLRRIRGRGLRQWRSALANRANRPANVWLVGDSMTEAFGASDDYHRWPWLFRDAIQRMFRSGGAGYIPCGHGVGFGSPTNPDGKNTWVLSGTALVSSADNGWGIGRRSSWLNTGSIATISVDCDRFHLLYTSAAGTSNMQIDIDSGTPFATTTTISTASGSVNQSGRIWDSGLLTPGTHTVKVTAVGGSNTVILEGIDVFFTDRDAGVHVYNSGHSGYMADAFSGSAVDGSKTWWADPAFQPAAMSTFTDGVGNGTTTFTSATAAFVDNDIAEWIFFPPVFGGSQAFASNNVAKIVSRNSGTSVVLDRVAPSGTALTFRINRSQLTDGSYSSGGNVLTSATAAFSQNDVGKFIVGPTGVPAGTYIRSVPAAAGVTINSCVVSQPFTATQSSQTFRIQNRQSYRMNPDLLVVEFGINELTGVGVTTATFKASIKSLVSLASEHGAVGVTPSVVLLCLWAIGSTGTMTFADGATINGTPTVTSDTADFGPEDVGKAITGTNIPASSFIGIINSNRSIGLSSSSSSNVPVNATGTGTAINMTIAARVYQDRHWQKQRTAMYEVADEMGWEVFDLYSIGGFIGATDPYGLTYDLVHPSDWGSQWIADELNQLLVGMPKNASIPQGIMDNVGDSVWGGGADIAAKLPPGVDGQAPVYRSAAKIGPAGVPIGVVPESPNSSMCVGQVVPVIGGTTAVATGLLPAPTLTATVSNADDNEASWLKFDTSGVAFNHSGIVSAAFTVTRPGRLPEFAVYWQSGVISNTAYAIGLCSASLDVASSVVPAAAVKGAYFLFNSNALDGVLRTVTSDGTTRTTKITTVSLVASTTYRFRIVCRGARGSTCSAIDFYVNDVLAATHTTNLPAVGDALGYGVRVGAMTAAAKAFKVARVSLSGP